MQEEVYFQCPYCGETISMLFEVAYPNQSYVEDCEVCCRPIQVYYTLKDNQIAIEEVKTLDA